MPGARFFRFLLVLVTGPLFAGTAQPSTDCDTILTKDGRTLVVDILRRNAQEVQYQLCGASGEVSYALKMEQVLRIKPKAAYSASKVEGAAGTKAKRRVGNSRLGLQRPGGYSLWAGLALEMFATTNNEPKLHYLLAGEYAFRFSGWNIGLVVMPVRAGTGYNPDKKGQQEGVNGEVGLILKQFTVGPLSGHISTLYWGLDLRIGRQSFRYRGPSAGIVTETTIWKRAMLRTGWQLQFRRLALDLAFPIGIQVAAAREFGHRSTKITLLPGITCGYTL